MTKLSYFLAGFFGLGAAALAQAPQLKTYPTLLDEKPVEIWSKADLFATPRVYPATETGLGELPDVKPIFYDGVPYQGKPTRVFAWLGIPANAKGPVPGVVLVHGGGGTAFRDWVKAWVDRGYAAIAMDLTGCVPVKPEGVTMDKVQHAYAPKKFIHGGFAEIDDPVADQWFYQAVAAVTRANTLLGTQKNVDPNRIGVTGSSWGGVLTILAMGVDPRFKFAAPVYGCGFLGENSSWLEKVMQDLPPEKARKWVQLWDPGHYIGHNNTPVLFSNGTNDLHFRPDSWQKTYQAAKGPVTLSMKVRMGHGHYPDGDPREITAFANSIVQKQAPLAKFVRQGSEEGSVWAEYADDRAQPVVKAELNFTRDSGDWVKRSWLTAPATLEGGRKRASGSLPRNVTAYYFNFIDGRGCVVSSPHVVIKKKAEAGGSAVAEVDTVKWDSPTNVTGESDIVTEGEPVVAYTFGSTSGEAISVNGVDFRMANSAAAIESLGHDSATGYVMGRPSELLSEPFATLSPEYQNILKRFWYGASSSIITITLENLEPATNYLLQLWVADCQTVHRGISTDFTIGSDTSGGLDPNDTNAAGGVGQYVIGRFHTGKQTTSVDIITNKGGQINALQLRKVP